MLRYLLSLCKLPLRYAAAYRCGAAKYRIEAALFVAYGITASGRRVGLSWTVGDGTHQRFVVDRDRFEQRLARKQPA